MKRSLYVAMGMLLVIAAAGAAYALTGEQLKVKIPFEFTINDKVLPAGTYEISYDAHPAVMVIRDTNGPTEETRFIVEDLEASKVAAKTELVFDEIGSQHFLRQIWVAGRVVGNQVALTKSEKALKDKGAKMAEKRVCVEHPTHKAM